MSIYYIIVLELMEQLIDTESILTLTIYKAVLANMLEVIHFILQQIVPSFPRKKKKKENNNLLNTFFRRK